MTHIAVNQETGAAVALVGGEWKPISKVAASGDGRKAYLVGDSWVEDDKPSSPASSPLPERPAGLRRPEELSALDKLLVAGPNIPQPVVDVAAGASGLMRGGANLISSGLGDKIWPKSVSQDSGFRTAGQFLDPVSWAVGGGVGKLLPYIPVMGRGAVEGIKATGRNLFSGGVAGGVIGGLSDEGDAATGAGIGAGLNVVLPPAISAAARGAGKVIDEARGKVTDIKAANILRQAAGNDLAAIRAATAAAPDEITAAQATAGIKNDTWNALEDLAKRADKESYFSRLSEKQRQDVLDGLRRIAGGANQTEARQSAEATKGALNTLTTPMREIELGAANTAGKLLPRLQAEADRLSGAASSKVEDVRRISSAQEIADRYAQSGRYRLDADSQPSGMPRLSGKYSYPAELERTGERLAQGSADDSLILGAGARDAQARADSLAAHGLKPLDTEKMVATIESKLSNPSIGVSDVNKRVLTRISRKIQEWTERGGGVIDARALYEIRKNSVNEEVERLMRGADPTMQAKRAAGILREVRPLIDYSIQAAGGTGWRNYLNTFEAGAKQIDQKRMGAKALDLFESSPKQFESLAAGNEPRMVEKIFRSEYDIAGAMGGKMNPIDRAAAYLSREREILEGAARGRGGLETILEENISKFKLPNWINAKIAVTNRALSEIENRVNKATMNRIYYAMKTGKSANELLNTLPTADRVKVLGAIIRGQATPYLVGGSIASQVSSQQGGEQ